MTNTRDHHGQKAGGVLEFSRLHVVDAALADSAEGESFELVADEGERAALAQRFDIEALDSFRVTGRIDIYDHGRGARVTARIEAELVQSCIVTLEPVAARIDETFSLCFEKDGPGLERDMNLDPAAPMDEGPPEPLPDEGIDLGEMAAEFLGLAIDPYPRAPGADETLAKLAADAARRERREKEETSPFAVLKRLKKTGNP